MMTRGDDVRARLRALARRLALGARLTEARPPADTAVALNEVWPARREREFWLGTPTWPEGYPAPGALRPETPRATILDVESLGRTPKPVCAVGFADVTDEGVAFRQFIAAHPVEEQAVIAAAVAAVNGAPLLVTYNGLTFDLPVLRDRAAYWRQPAPTPRCHVDLLPLVRRYYRRKTNMPACGLAEAERFLLGVARPDDIRSADVPDLYERGIQIGDARPLFSILRHNLYDLAAMTLLYLKIVNERPTAFQPKPSGDAGELFA